MNSLDETVEGILNDISMYYIKELNIEKRYISTSLEEESSLSAINIEFNIKHILDDHKYPKIKLIFTVVNEKLENFISIEIRDSIELVDGPILNLDNSMLISKCNKTYSIYKELCFKIRDTNVMDSLIKYIL